MRDFVPRKCLNPSLTTGPDLGYGNIDCYERAHLMLDTYFDSITAKLQEIRAKEAVSIRKAASACAKSLMDGGVVHLFDTGHMINQEFNGRVGGLVAFTPFGFNMTVSSPNGREDRQTDQSPNSEVIALALKRSSIRPGDVLLLGSVSGKTFVPVELALQAGAMGVTVVGVTGIAHSSEIQSDHPSGKRLFEVADIVIDTHVDPGDAMIAVEGMERKVCPSSGVCAAAALWAMTAVMTAEMAAAGKPPTVYRSVNLPGGAEDVKKTQELYKERKI
jgi:uncharacterized phosphosugar-binding protein